MKTLFLFLTLATLTLKAQTFTVTPEGLKDSLNISKNYLVIPLEKTAEEMYTNTLKYIHKNYKNPNEVLKGNLKNEFLSFQTYDKEAFKVFVKVMNVVVDLKYTTNLSFKEGRFKYEISNLIMNYSSGPIGFKGSMYARGINMYDKKSRLRVKNLKIALEKYFNNNLKKLQLNMSGENLNSDDW